MNQNPNAGKYAKAKIETPFHLLPRAFMKINMDPSTGELCYVKLFEDDPMKADRLNEELAKGAKLDRKVYRIRNIDLVKASGPELEDLRQIHRASNAIIGILVDSDSDYRTHSFLDILGTVEQVKKAEELILDKILKTYEGMLYPIILMPPTVYGHGVRLHMDKVARLIGGNLRNIIVIEAVSGAWLQCDGQPPADGPNDVRVVNVYGPRPNVFKAVSLIHLQVFELGESLQAERELDMLFRQLSFDEMIECMRPRAAQMTELMRPSFASLFKSSSGSGSSSGTGSGQTEEHKKQHVEEAKGKDEPKGEKLQQHEEEAKDRDESKDKKEAAALGGC